MPLSFPSDAEVLGKLIAWGQAEPLVCALLLSSSRARPGGPVDALSDYDIIVVVTDADRFVQDESWLSAYGRPLARWGDAAMLEGLPTHFYGVVYDDFVKIDYTLWPAALMERVAARRPLPDELDAGYRVLLDKDDATAAWTAPTYQAFIPSPPTPAAYRALVEEFWWSSTYVAKSLWRDELLFARFCLDNDLKLGVLRRLLEWRLELEHHWQLRPGLLGRGLKPRLPADRWAALAATFVGPDLEENWQALFATVGLFRQVAREVAGTLRYTYPDELDARMTAYLDAVRQLPKHPDAVP